jgi:monovalent cation/hydrogen antiporter
VAALSLLGYGGTLPRLIRATGITRENAQEVRDELDSVLDELLQRAGDQVGRPEDLMIEGEPVAPAVLERVRAAMSRLGRARDDLQRPEALSERQQAAVLQRRYLDALREGLREERAVGAYSTRTLQRVERLLDAEELRLDGPAPA